MKVKQMRLKNVEEFSCNHEKHMIHDDDSFDITIAVCLQCKTWVGVILTVED